MLVAGCSPQKPAAWGNVPDADVVGHVNGRPVHANRVFELIDEQLTTRGKVLSRQRFCEEARQIIAAQLQTIVTEMLLVAEAEEALTEQQCFGLRQMLAEQRAALLRKLGNAPDGLADERVDEFRQRVILENHARATLFPKINITRKDIERRFHRNRAKYRPKPGRTIHMIRTTNADDAETIDRLLAEGRPFLEVAADPELNRYGPAAKGLFVEAFEGDAIFGDEQLNAATLALAAGQHTPRIKVKRLFCWVCVTKIRAGKVPTLEELEPEIRRQLEVMEFRRLELEYRTRLLQEGRFDPVGPPEDPLAPMVAALLELAMRRYARPR